MSSVGCGLVGCGTVGEGVVRLWGEHVPGVGLRAVAVRDLAKPRRVDLDGVRVTADAWDVVRDPGVTVVIEATGDVALGHELAVESVARGKSFVTASKALVARCGPELEERAGARGVAFRYEAAAGGALPVVALLRLGLSPGRVRGFSGVLNGTCNFVLSRLREGRPFAAALSEARARGFAEADSSRDTSGRDAAEKLVVLARLLGVRLRPEELHVRGIDGLRPEDVAFGERRGLARRLVASFRDEGGVVRAAVAPLFVPASSALAEARDEENVLVLDGGAGGPLTLIGRGAGGLPTACAILADVREILRDGAGASLPPPRRPAAVEADDEYAPQYVRMDAFTDAGQPLLRALGDAGVEVEYVGCGGDGRVQVLTRRAPPGVVREAIARVPGRERVQVALRDPAGVCGQTA